MASESHGFTLAPGVWVPPGAVAFSFSSSSGPGGQNVNKRATKAELRIALEAIPIHPEARERLAHMAGHLVTAAGVLIIEADEHRSQERNKSACLERLRELIVRAMVRPKKRRATRPSRGSVERRLEAKRIAGARKRTRRDGWE